MRMCELGVCVNPNVKYVHAVADIVYAPPAAWDGPTLFCRATLYCNGKYNCVIGRDQQYKSYPIDRGLNNPVSYCMKCYQEAPDEITLGPEENNKTILRIDFVDAWNRELTEEPYVECTECGRKGHEICQLWFKKLAKRFVCKHCTRGRPIIYPNPAHKLQRSKLGDHLESRLRKLLQPHDQVKPDQMDVTVRVVSIREKNMTVMPGMKEYYGDSEDPYVST